MIILKKSKNRNKKNQKIMTILNITNTWKQKWKKKDSYQLQEMKTIK